MLIERLKTNSSYITLILASIALLYLITRQAYLYTGPIGGIFVASIISITSSNKRNDTIGDIGDKITFFSQFRKSIIFISTYISLVVIIHHGTYYSRPILFYPLYTLSFGIVGYRLMSGAPRSLILMEIIIISAGAYLSPQLLYPNGVLGLDLAKIIPATERIFESGHVPHEQIRYGTTPTHMIYVAQSSKLTGVKILNQYIFLSYIPLIIGILGIGILDKVINGITEREALIAAAVFSTAAFTIRSGIHVDKLTFFTASTVLIVYCMYQLLHSKNDIWRYFLLACFSYLYILLGHPYSAGAATVIAMSFGGYTFISQWLHRFTISKQQFLMILACITFISLLLFAALADLIRLLDLFGSMLLSTRELLIPSSSTSGGPPALGGRYSSSSIKFILLSALSQFILFALGISGCVCLFTDRRLDTDLPTAVTVLGLMLIGLGVLTGNADFIPQRFVWLITLFGLNIGFAVSVNRYYNLSKNKRNQVFVVCIMLFSAGAIASPITGIFISPVSSDVPHVAPYETSPHQNGEQWIETHATESIIRGGSMPVAIINDDSVSGTIRTSSIEQNDKYLHTRVYTQAGILVSNRGPGIGTRIRAFVYRPECIKNDNKLYTNSHYHLYHRTAQSCSDMSRLSP